MNYQGSQMKCISLYNSLFVREAADSNQCQAAKDSHAQDCCFEKCNMCKVGYLDTTATVRVGGVDMSCSALDMSFSKDVIMEGSEQCNEYRSQFSDACCYTIPDNPCKVCPAGSDVYGDVSVDFYGETKSCADIGNKLARKHPVKPVHLHKETLLMLAALNVVPSVQKVTISIGE